MGLIAACSERVRLETGLSSTSLPQECQPGRLWRTQILKVRAGAAGFDDGIDFVRLARVLALARGEEIHLAPSRCRGAQAAAGAEKNQFGDVAEVEADAASV